MNSNKKTGRIVGALFLIVMISWTIGFSIIEPILNTPVMTSKTIKTNK